jgi:FAD/FMN-containing dehydrogenase
MENWRFKTLRRGTDEYEAARKKAVWNGRVPPRYPEIIAFPTCDAEVVECVIYAKKVGMSIGTKSGGHSWTASFLREGGMLLDLVGMKEISPDIARKVCEIQPGAYGADLNALIGPEGLMFPGGHCPTVGIGGFLLQSGFGWNSRTWGMACESVLSLDCVNADGQLLHCDSSQNADFYWAARGQDVGSSAW